MTLLAARYIALFRTAVSRLHRSWRARRLCRAPVRRRPGVTGSVSLVTTNYQNADTFPEMLHAWLDFVGQRPDEIIVTDGGSSAEVMDMYRRLFDEGLIDKLFVQQPTHPENTRQTCFVQEYYAGALASGDFLLFWRPDTIPYRRGHDGWLQEYAGILAADPRVFAITGSSPGPAFLGEADSQFWCLEHTSENFALVSRRHHVDAMRICQEFWGSGWRGRNPFAQIGPVAARCLIESAWDVYCRRKGLRVLMQKEDETWSVFHTNAHGENLQRLRALVNTRVELGRFRNRQGPFLSLDGIEPVVAQRRPVAAATPVAPDC